VGESTAAVLNVSRSAQESRGGEIEDEVHARRMDDWIVWEAEGPVVFVPRISLFFSHICKGDPYPENGAPRRLGVEDFLGMG
jgi:hypothetical protein